MKNYFIKNKFWIFLTVILITVAIYLMKSHPERLPAAVQQNNFFDMLKPESPFVALQKDVISGFQVTKQQKEFIIQLRNFNLNLADSKQPVCSYFSNYKLTFEAEGIATNGERPLLVISSPCMLSNSTRMPIPVRIPVEDIYKLKPSNSEIRFQINPDVTFAFKNIPDSWPEYWVLAKIEFENDSALSRNLIIERKEIFQLSSQPLTMDWAPF